MSTAAPARGPFGGDMTRLPSRIIVIGATGFTGQQVLKQLESADVQVTCLVRPGRTAPDWSGRRPLTIVRGTLEDPVALERALAEKDLLLYVASLGFGHGADVVAACEKAGVKRAVFVSTTAIFTGLNAASKSVRQAAEQAIVDSRLAWTLLRPTMIYGRPGDRNMERLVRWVRRFGVVFAPGGGRALMQPVHVDDVAGAVVAAATTETTARRAYNISGAAPLPFREVVALAGEALGRRARVVSVPLGPCRFVLRLYEKISKNPRLKEEQLLRLNEDKAFEHTEAAADFGFAPRDFATGVGQLVALMGLGAGGNAEPDTGAGND